MFDFFSVEVLLKAAGDAPIMTKKKWVVDGSKQVAYLIEFIKKYIRCEESDSLVRKSTGYSVMDIYLCKPCIGLMCR